MTITVFSVVVGHASPLVDWVLWPCHSATCSLVVLSDFLFFFFNAPATPEIYPLSLHDALPISTVASWGRTRSISLRWQPASASPWRPPRSRSEEHTSELQSRLHLVCRLLL